MTLTTWQDALDFLYRRANWEAAPPGVGPEFKLGRVRRLLALLGNPQDTWRAVHVGGTNGKGSTSAIIATGLRSAGYRVGLFTSPHMHTMRERIRVNDTYISEEAILAWLNRHQDTLQSMDGLTTFEALVALAFSHFANTQVDVAVVEVGLGGQLDATNVLSNQLLSVITPIGLDHTEILGDTVEQIAADKAGIFRPGVPAVIAPQQPEAYSVLRHQASLLGTPLLTVGTDVTWRVTRDDLAGQWLEIDPGHPLTFSHAKDGHHPQREARSYVPFTGPLHFPLLGRHQQANAATAVAALDLLNRTGLHVSPDAIRHGAAATRWPGRLEVFTLPNGGHLVLDGAHNPHGAAALVEALEHYFPSAPRHLILGIGGGKDASSIIAELIPGANSIITARSEHPKALPAELVADLVQTHPAFSSTIPLDVAPTPADAVRTAISRAQPGDVVICAGSIFLVADAREAWFTLIGQPLPPHDPPMG